MSSKIGAGAVLLAILLFVPDAGNTQIPAAPSHARVFAVGDLLYYGLEPVTERVGQLVERLYKDNPDSTIILLGDVCNKDGSKQCYDELQYGDASGFYL